MLRAPGWLTDLLAERRQRLVHSGLLFPNSVGSYRDVSAVNKEFRRVRAGTAFEWVVPHTYRKTVATLLDQGGLSARTVADQLGHAQISMTQNVYLGRRVVDDSAAQALDEVLLRVVPGAGSEQAVSEQFRAVRDRHVTVRPDQLSPVVASGQ